MTLVLDHIFIFTEPGGGDGARRLAELGLVPTYGRRHEGQGTANLCFAFDNAYLELLWVEEPERLARATFARTGLFERSTWRTHHTSPFGVAVRADQPLPFACWLWRPPYLSPGLFVEVAATSTDPNVPFLFTFPGSTAPATWPAERRGRLQRDAGLTGISGLRLNALPEGDDLRELIVDPTLDRQSAVLEIAATDGATRRLALPDCRWLA